MTFKTIPHGRTGLADSRDHGRKGGPSGKLSGAHGETPRVAR